MSRENDLKRLILNYNRRLQKLKELQALQGLDTPTHIIIEIEDIEKTVEVLEKELKQLSRKTALIDPSKYYYIVSAHTSKCLEIAESGKDNGTDIIQWSIRNSDNQKWQFVSVNGKYFTIISKHSGKCLDVEMGKKENGARIQQWRVHHGLNQQWELMKSGVEYLKIRSRLSRKCLDVAYGRSQNGVKIQQWTCHRGNNQKWMLLLANE